MSLPPPPSVIAERKDKLADFVSRGLTVAQAALRMGISESNAYRLWAEIKRELGPQAA